MISQAKMYWTSVEGMAMYQRQEPIKTWDEMKVRLRKKYLPSSNYQYLVNQWQWPILKYERFSRLPITHRPEPSRQGILDPRPNMNLVNQTPIGCPSFIILPTERDDKEKDIIR